MKEGEMICEIQPIDEGWWQGKNEDGHVGLFPSNYVEVVENPSPMERHMENEAQDESQHMEGVNQQTEEINSEMPYAIALYDYEATEEGELSFLTMDKIEKIEFISEEWWQGTNAQGEAGLFPANYVELQE
ncbi:hypothetical protein K502DRAFT_230866 [Neoconidiobolus thromboides FSU 785]|nr:hypothetical protein K502DRAFT_230866 [Neoconidiobolus thromboides FSU 785]